ncbi:Rpn family recombination-promoting nuclease/putative transposase [Leptospira noguchii]|nr:Rpn family recombination-promoting nuclease/putative transposase [Leptospira noguchii]
MYRNQHKNGKPISVVIPFVFYHGEKNES